MALLRYLLRRLRDHGAHLDRHLGARVLHHQAAARRLSDQPDRGARAPRATRRASPRREFLRHQFGLDLPVWQQYLAWVGADAGAERLVRPAAGQLGLVLRIQPAGERGRRPGAAADARGQSRRGHLRPYRGDPDRHLFGGAPIFDRRLPRHRSSAISGSRRRASCSRSCCSSTSTAGSASRSAA